LPDHRYILIDAVIVSAIFKGPVIATPDMDSDDRFPGILKVLFEKILQAQAQRVAGNKEGSYFSDVLRQKMLGTKKPALYKTKRAFQGVALFKIKRFIPIERYHPYEFRSDGKPEQYTGYEVRACIKKTVAGQGKAFGC
jgi:hypothetical protein